MIRWNTRGLKSNYHGFGLKSATYRITDVIIYIKHRLWNQFCSFNLPENDAYCATGMGASDHKGFLQMLDRGLRFRSVSHKGVEELENHQSAGKKS